MIGQIVNHRYEVLEKVGDGPLFSVYKSRDKVLNRLVALKVLNSEFMANQQWVAAVVSGYQDAARLTHPNIARVVDADSIPSECFVATEFARGVSVGERIHRAGSISAPTAVEIIMPVLAALDYAHSNGVIHGDLAPQDIIVSPDGEVKLTDLGLSGALLQCPQVAERYTMRSVYYQAPEIAEGATPTPASDVYSVGSILYEMLTGQRPFEGSTAIAVALKKIKEIPVAPRQINTAIPKSLNDIVMRALETSPQNRYQSIAAMLTDLKAVSEALRTGRPVGASAVAVARQVDKEESLPQDLMAFKWWYVALFVVVVFVMGGITMTIQKGNAKITVPPLLGKTWEEAQEIATDKGIELVDDGRVYSNMYPAGQICSVVPPADGKVPKDNPQVKVKISSGPSEVAIPDLTGLTQSDANAKAVEAGFTVGSIREKYSDQVPANSVISQDPLAGTLYAPGTAIDLVISTGPKPQEQETEQPESPSSSVTESQQRKLKVNVEVSSDAEGPQEVKIIATDDRGDNTAYEENRDPGDRFTVTVPTYGSSARIRVYVGGELVSDDTY
ncbi:MAG: PASTA domain-containing protein [Armatimonadota bacterium]|nr:PASTA domain-containing protein [bacterium]